MFHLLYFTFFFFNDTATTEIYTLSLHDALPIYRLAFNEAQSFSCAGIQKNDIVQLMTTMDRRFMAGLAYFLGIRKLGAAIIRTGAGIPALQWESILNNKPTYLIAVPSFLLKMIDYEIGRASCRERG